jgi:hypothetical protein
MSFLTAAQSAAIRLIGKKPTTFFSSSNKFELEITDLANEVVADLTNYADWRNLVTLKTMPGDGVTIGFDLPSDYGRMPFSQEVARANWYTWGYVDAPDLNFWRDLINGLASPSPGYWIILNGQMQFQPPVAASTIAQYYYISNNAVLAADGVTKKSAFDADTDTLEISNNTRDNDRLLTLGLIWRWRAQKRMEYAEDMQNYEILASQVSGADRGAHILSAGNRRLNWDSQWAYPRSLGT